MAQVEFAPIKVSGCDEERVKRVSKKNFVLPFTLSVKPNGDWADIFEDVWHAYRKGSPSGEKANAYVRKNEIVLECPLASVKLHFPNLKNAVDVSNQKYIEQQKVKAEKSSKKKKKRDEERLVEKTAIHEALQGIDFS